MWNDLLYRLRVLFQRERMEKELDEEVAFHLEHEAEKLRSSGISEDEAMRRAELAIGGKAQLLMEV